MNTGFPAFSPAGQVAVKVMFLWIFGLDAATVKQILSPAQALTVVELKSCV